MRQVLYRFVSVGDRRDKEWQSSRKGRHALAPHLFGCERELWGQCMLSNIGSAPVSVLLVDDHAVIRKGLKIVFGNSGKLVVCGEAVSGEEAVERFQSLRPDVVLMDVRMPGMGGVEATRQIVACDANALVVGFSAHQERSEIEEMKAAGATALLGKCVDAEKLVALLVAIGKRTPLPQCELFPEEERALEPDCDTLMSIDTEAPGWQQLSVLELMTDGLSDDEISRHLGLSLSTTAYHVNAIQMKLGATSRADVINKYLQSPSEAAAE